MKLFLQKNAKFSSAWSSAPRPPKQPPIANFWLRVCRHLYCYSALLCFTAIVTLLLRLSDEFDGIWTSCDLGRRFRRGYGDFGFYDHRIL